MLSEDRWEGEMTPASLVRLVGGMDDYIQALQHIMFPSPTVHPGTGEVVIDHFTTYTDRSLHSLKYQFWVWLGLLHNLLILVHNTDRFSEIV